MGSSLVHLVEVMMCVRFSHSPVTAGSSSGCWIHVPHRMYRTPAARQKFAACESSLCCRCRSKKGKIIGRIHGFKARVWATEGVIFTGGQSAIPSCGDSICHYRTPRTRRAGALADSCSQCRNRRCHRFVKEFDNRTRKKVLRLSGRAAVD